MYSHSLKKQTVNSWKQDLELESEFKILNFLWGISVNKLVIGRRTAVPLTSRGLNSMKLQYSWMPEKVLELQSESSSCQENYREQYLTRSAPTEITGRSGYLEFPLWIRKTNLNFNLSFQNNKQIKIVQTHSFLHSSFFMAYPGVFSKISWLLWERNKRVII